MDLVDPIHLILHRIFNSNDLFVRLINALQCRVKGGRLTATGGARHKQNAVRQGRVVSHAIQHVLVEAQAL